MAGVCENAINKNFSTAHTQILKGIAVILLLLHHGLSALTADGLVLANTVSLSKLCVAIFTVLSGYGMFFSLRLKNRNNSFRASVQFAVYHLIKIFLVFWLSAAVQIAAVSLIKGNFFEIYTDHPFYYLLLDGMGLSYITNTPKFVNAWWYMTAITIYYLLFPVLFWAVSRLQRWNYLLVAVSAVLLLCGYVSGSIAVYGIFFLYGMIFAQQNLFNRILNCRAGKGCKSVLWLCVFFLLCWIRQRFLYGTGLDYHLDWLLVFVLVLCVCELSFLGIFKPAGKALGKLGAYSFELYLTHSVFLKYFGKAICTPAVWYSIVFKLFFASFLAAWLLKLLERVMRTDRIVSLCRTKTGGRIAACLIAACVFLLPAPKLIADQGLGKWELKKSEIVMQLGNCHVMQYQEVPVLWELAGKSYCAEDNEIVNFIDGIVFAHKTGTTTVTVSLPCGKTLSCTVTVQ